MMRMITDHGRRLDIPATDLENLIYLARAKPYQALSDADKAQLKLLLSLQHAEREQRRFAPI